MRLEERMLFPVSFLLRPAVSTRNDSSYIIWEPVSGAVSMAVDIPATPHIVVAGDFNCSVPGIDKIGPKSMKI